MRLSHFLLGLVFCMFSGQSLKPVAPLWFAKTLWAGCGSVVYSTLYATYHEELKQLRFRQAEILGNRLANSLVHSLSADSGTSKFEDLSSPEEGAIAARIEILERIEMFMWLLKLLLLILLCRLLELFAQWFAFTFGLKKIKKEASVKSKQVPTISDAYMQKLADEYSALRYAHENASRFRQWLCPVWPNFFVRWFVRKK